MGCVERRKALDARIDHSAGGAHVHAGGTLQAASQRSLYSSKSLKTQAIRTYTTTTLVQERHEWHNRIYVKCTATYNGNQQGIQYAKQTTGGAGDDCEWTGSNGKTRDEAQGTPREGKRVRGQAPPKQLLI